MPKLKHVRRPQIFNIASGVALIFIALFGCAGRLSAEESVDVRLKAIDAKLKAIEASQNQVTADQESMLEKIKTLKERGKTLLEIRRILGGGASHV